MDTNSSRSDEYDNLEASVEYSDVDEATDSIAKTIKLVEKNAHEVDLELVEAIEQVNVVLKYVSKCFTRFLTAFIKSLTSFPVGRRD